MELLSVGKKVTFQNSAVERKAKEEGDGEAIPLQNKGMCNGRYEQYTRDQRHSKAAAVRQRSWLRHARMKESTMRA